MLVSIDFPFSIAVMLQPFPRWHVISFSVFKGELRISAARMATY